jgi:hypothetical protein
MDEKERELVDLPGLIRYFRRFHIFLGISTFLLFVILTLLSGSAAGGAMLALYPILAYTILMWKTRRFYTGTLASRARYGPYLMAIPLLAVGVLLWAGLKNDPLTFSTSSVTISGIYGETLDLDNTGKIELVSELPLIKRRSNGFALGEVRKGYFAASDGSEVKLIINRKQDHYVLLTRSDGLKIYFSDRDEGNPVIYVRLMNSYKNKTPRVAAKGLK